MILVPRLFVLMVLVCDSDGKGMFWKMDAVQPRRSLDFCCCTREENGLTVLKGVCESPRLGLAETLNLCGDAQQPGLPVEARHVVRKVPAERMFKVKLQKLADGFGLKYDASDSNVLLVQRVTDGGAASQWNQTAQPKIQPYDRVVEVTCMLSTCRSFVGGV